MKVTSKQLTLLWSEKFDAIYMVIFADNYNTRYKKLILPELKRVGILDSGIFMPIFTETSLLKQKIYDASYLAVFPYGYYHFNIWKSMYDQCYSHYRTLNVALKLGNKHILVLEDDVCFLKDLNEIYDILTSTPEDYDICLYDFATSLKILGLPATSDGKFIPYHKNTLGVGNGSAACYALSDKGINSIIDYQNNLGRLFYADHVLIQNDFDCKRYLSKIPLAVQNTLLEANLPENRKHEPFYTARNINLKKYNIKE